MSGETEVHSAPSLSNRSDRETVFGRPTCFDVACFAASQVVGVFNHHLHFKLSGGGLSQQWHRLSEVLYPWYEQIQAAALQSAVLHAIRPAVIIRKNSYCNRSQRGANTQAVLMSVYRTLQQPWS